MHHSNFAKSTTVQELHRSLILETLNMVLLFIVALMAANAPKSSPDPHEHLWPLYVPGLKVSLRCK